MISEIKNVFHNNEQVIFKMYGVEYIIKKELDYVIIYQALYPEKIKRYNSIDELFNYYTIYNERIIDNQEYITIEQEKEQIL